MELPLPEYVDARIRRRPPEGLPVVPGSTPVVAFGDVRKATVATLGWNPSKLEFLDSAGNELAGQERRLQTLSSLGTGNLATAGAEVIGRVFQSCNDYFQLRPYRKWFDVLEKVLHPQGVSYYNGTACHLDFVQWATDPTWRDLQRVEKERLIEADIPFLRQQLAHEHVQLLLLNGSGIAKACSKRLGLDLAPIVLPGRTDITLFVGHTPEEVQVIGWNLNLQSSFGVSNEYIKAVALAIQEIRSRP